VNVLLAPAAVTYPIATSWNKRIDLSWVGASGATSYVVKRTTGTDTTTIATITGLTYSDTMVTNGTAYTYIIYAANSAGASPGSAAAATPVNQPNTWTHSDIGSTVLTGNAGYANGITAYGSGADIWGTADAFHFTYQPLSGDGAMVAHVASLQTYATTATITSSAKAGVMMREAVTAGSRHGIVNVTPGGGLEFIKRTSTNGSSAANSVSGITAPYWVKMVRTKDTLTAYRSADGINWTSVGSQTYTTLASNIYVGLVVCSHNTAVITRGVFDTVSVATAVPTITSAKTAGGIVDSSFSFQLVATNSTYHYTVTGLPGGLSINIGTGLISGTPTASGTFPVVVTATNALGTTTDNLVITVMRNQVINFAALTDARVGAADFNAGATASSALPVSYSSSNQSVAIIVNNLVHVVGTGVTTITASQTGDSTYNAAPAVSRQLVTYRLPTMVTKNIQVAVDNNGAASITAQQVDSGSVSYSGALTLSVNRTAFSCADIGSPVTVILTGTDANGHADSATAQVTVVDTTAPVVAAPQDQLLCYSNSGAYTIPALTATDNCGVASVSYVVSGATSRSGTGANASGAFNTGLSTIVYTVNDVHGNTSTDTTLITVNAALSAVIPNVYAMNAAVDDTNTLYIGYGPTSLTITATPNGGTAPYRYVWNTGDTTAAISISAAGTYSVTVTDSKGCTATASIVMKTLDVRCGNNLNKVKICHNGKSICISSGDVQNHLNHGDYLGDCTQGARQANTTAAGNDNATIINVYPNPVNETLTIRLGPLNTGAVMQLYNANGVLVKTERLVNSTTTLSVRSLAAGMYYISIKNGSATFMHKIVKL